MRPLGLDGATGGSSCVGPADALGGLKRLVLVSPKYRLCCAVGGLSFAGSVDKPEVSKGRVWRRPAPALPCAASQHSTWHPAGKLVNPRPAAVIILLRAGVCAVELGGSCSSKQARTKELVLPPTCKQQQPPALPGSSSISEWHLYKNKTDCSSALVAAAGRNELLVLFF